MATLSRRSRILLGLGLAGAATAFTIGGVAYAVGGTGDGGSGDSAYVRIDGSAAETNPETNPDTSPETAPDEGTQPRGGVDCPEKDGQGGQGNGQGGTEAPESAPDTSNAAGRA